MSWTRARLWGIVLLAVSLLGASTAQAKPPDVSYPTHASFTVRPNPTKITTGLKVTMTPSGESARVFVRVTSSYPGCKRHRPLILLTEVEHNGVVPEPGLKTDATGYWQAPEPWVEPFLTPNREAIRDGQYLIRAKAPRIRLDKQHVCAMALSDYLKA